MFGRDREFNTEKEMVIMGLVIMVSVVMVLVIIVLVVLVTLVGFMMVTMKVDSSQVLARDGDRGPGFEECGVGDDGDIGDENDVGDVGDENEDNQESYFLQVLARGEGRGPAGFEDRGEPGEDPGD